MTRARGVDVSVAQGPSVDWAAARAAGVEFAIVKLTEADTGVDPTGLENAARARAAGLAVSFYHYANLHGSPEGQAALFARQIRAAGGADFPPALDLEHVDPRTMRSPLSKADTCVWAVRFVKAMHAEGFPVLRLYSYPSYLFQLMPELASSGLAEITELWIADYSKGASPPEGSVPATHDPSSPLYLHGLWPSWAAWQTHGDDQKGAAPGSPGAPRIPGFPGAVDHDTLNGPLSSGQGPGASLLTSSGVDLSRPLGWLVGLAALGGIGWALGARTEGRKTLASVQIRLRSILASRRRFG